MKKTNFGDKLIAAAEEAMEHSRGQKQLREWVAIKDKIDFSDIPEWTSADFKRARRVTPIQVKVGRKANAAKLGVKRPRRGRPSMG